MLCIYVYVYVYIYIYMYIYIYILHLLCSEALRRRCVLIWLKGAAETARSFREIVRKSLFENEIVQMYSRNSSKREGSRDSSKICLQKKYYLKTKDDDKNNESTQDGEVHEDVEGKQRPAQREQQGVVLNNSKNDNDNNSNSNNNSSNNE